MSPTVRATAGTLEDATDLELLPGVVAAVRAVGARLLEVHSAGARPVSRDDLLAAAQRHEDLAAGLLGPALSALRPAARWVGEDQETTALWCRSLRREGCGAQVPRS